MIVIERCVCEKTCGDRDPDGLGVCKGLPRAPAPPLVEIVMVPRVPRRPLGECDHGVLLTKPCADCEAVCGPVECAPVGPPTGPDLRERNEASTPRLPRERSGDGPELTELGSEATTVQGLA